MTDLTSVINELSTAKTAYEHARSQKAGVKLAENRLLNTVVNHLDEIMNGLSAAVHSYKEIEGLKADIASMENSLAKADKMYIDLKKQVKKQDA